MAPKRKLDDEDHERFLSTMFQEAAGNLSHFYTDSVNHQKSAFEAGETYAILKLNEWMLTKVQGGRGLTVPQIFEYLQSKLSNWIPGLVMPEQDGGSGSEPSTRLQLGSSSSFAPNTPKEEGSADVNMDAAF